MERKNEQKTENILWEIAEKMDVLYEEQACRMSVIKTVYELMEGAA